MIKPESNARWYDTNGNPRHEATLREARKENLLPSVTTVIGATLANPGLEVWKQNQVLLSALTCTKGDDENEKDWISRESSDI